MTEQLQIGRARVGEHEPEDTTVTKNIALFGGSFDPPHMGHIFVASYVLAVHDVDELWMIPCFKHVFHKHLTPFHHRVAMLQLSLAHLRGVKVSSVEQELKGASTTLRTVRALKAANPGATFQWVAGTDIRKELHKWHRPDELLKEIGFIFLPRAGFIADQTDGGAFSFPDIRSSRIRDALKGGGEIAGLLHQRVTDYIIRNGLYRGDPLQ